MIHVDFFIATNNYLLANYNLFLFDFYIELSKLFRRFNIYHKLIGFINKTGFWYMYKVILVII